MANTISREAAITNLHKWFTNTSSNSVTPAEVFDAVGRSDLSYEDNMVWLYNRLSVMREHDLFKKVFIVRGGKTYIDRIDLTLEGRKALGRDVDTRSSGSAQANLSASPQAQNPSVNPDVPKVVTLQFATDVTDAFNRQNPSWEWKLVRKGQPM